MRINAKILLAVLAPAAIGALVLTWSLGRPADLPLRAPIGSCDLSVPPSGAPGEVARKALSARESFEIDMALGTSAKTRLTALEVFAKEVWATSDNAILMRAAAYDPESEVRKPALEIAMRLARKEAPGAMDTVLSRVLNSPYKDAVQEALYGCQKEPSPTFTDKLLELSQRSSATRAQAVVALAHSPDERAQKRVVEVAKDATLPKNERLRAIALLSMLKVPEAADYLAELAGGEDAELKALAVKAMEAQGKRQ